MSLRQRERISKLKKSLEEPPVKDLPQDIAGFASSIGVTLDDWQRDLCEIVADKEKPARVFVLASRQSGKSYCTALASIFHALTVPNSTTLLLSPTLRQSSLLFRRVIQFYKASGRPVKPLSESALQLRLENGAWVQALPANETNIRGISSVSLLVIDEFSRVPESLYFAVLPMLATMPVSKLIALTTPAGKRGIAWREYDSGEGWTRIKVTADKVPRISAEYLKEARARLGERYYNQEFFCSWVDSADSIFKDSVIQRSVKSFETFDNLLDGICDVDVEEGTLDYNNNAGEFFINDLGIDFGD